MDLVCQVPRLPVSGETILGTDFMTVPGGKGANQAVAVARLGAPSRLVGRIGQDGFGEELVTSLQAAGVHAQGILADAAAKTGIAAIALDAQGHNHIIVIPGANGQINTSDVERLAQPFCSGEWLLMQLEIPLQAVVEAARSARAGQVRVMLDPAPAQPLPDALYPLIDVLTPNQGEAAQLVGFEVNTVSHAAAAARELRQRGVDTVIITLGDQGVWVDSPDGEFHQAAFAVEVIDTVAAGDAFNGSLAVALSEHQPLHEAVAFAAATAALCVSKSGAQAAMPERSQVHALLDASPTSKLPPR